MRIDYINVYATIEKKFEYFCMDQNEMFSIYYE